MCAIVFRRSAMSMGERLANHYPDLEDLPITTDIRILNLDTSAGHHHHRRKPLPTSEVDALVMEMMELFSAAVTNGDHTPTAPSTHAELTTDSGDLAMQSAITDTHDHHSGSFDTRKRSKAFVQARQLAMRLCHVSVKCLEL